jgi:hypothetical protein
MASPDVVVSMQELWSVALWEHAEALSACSFSAGVEHAAGGCVNTNTCSFRYAA